MRIRLESEGPSSLLLSPSLIVVRRRFGLLFGSGAGEGGPGGLLMVRRFPRCGGLRLRGPCVGSGLGDGGCSTSFGSLSTCP